MAIIVCPSCGARNRVTPVASGFPRCPKCKSELPWLVDADAETFDAETRASVPVIVDFWAAWCGPCRMLGPVLERLAAEAEGRWELAKVDTEAHPELAQRYGIMSIPCCKLFVDGEVFDEFTGALPEGELRRWLDEAIPSPGAAALAEARALLDEGRFLEAAARLRAVLDAEPRNEGAQVALGQALLRLDPAQVAETLRTVDEVSEHHEEAVALRTLAALALLADAPDRLPEGAARLFVLDAARSLRAGHIVVNETEPQTIADGARTVSLGRNNWNVLRDGLAGMVEISEEQIKEAVRCLFRLANLKAEPTGALGIAALLARSEAFRDRTVCCVVSGGNVDPSLFCEILAR
jgi:putative thioredoxin